jgi:hypothetical protein
MPLGNRKPRDETARPTPAELNHLVFDEFQHMDTQSTRAGLHPKRLNWLENLMPIGPNYLYTVPAPLSPLTSLTGLTIAKSFYAFFNNIDYQVAFPTDGSGWVINLASGAQTKFAVAGTFSNPDCTQWQSQRILIADPTAGYATYDANAFVVSGGLSPNIIITNGGSGYTGGATAAFSGGHGSGATATVTVVGGIVTAITLTNAGTGYLASDTVTITISAVSGGSGATATCKVWPQFTGTFTTLAVYLGRVWLGAGRTLTFTGTGGYDDAAAADASGSTTIADSDLVHSITALRALNNYLWIFGDASVKQIGTISVTSGVTNFSIVTLTSDTGTTFPQSISSYNRLVLFANKTGVWAALGASVQKISNEMDFIFQNANFGVPLQAALNDIGSAGIGGGSIRCYLLLIAYLDPANNGAQRTLLLTFFERKWFVMNQGNDIISMSTAKISGSLETFASSGSDVTQIVQNPNTSVNFLLKTALWHDGKQYLGKRVTRAAVTQTLNEATSSTVSWTIDTENGSTSGVSPTYNFGIPVTWINAIGGTVTWFNALGSFVSWITKGVQFQPLQPQGGSGIYLGMTLQGSAQQTSIQNMIIEYVEVAPMRSFGGQ